MKNQNHEHLDLLGIFHYVVGGFGVLFACIPIIHFVIGVGILTGNLPFDQTEETMPQAPNWFGLIFAIMGGGMFLMGQAAAWCTIYSGKMLRQRKKHTFSFVIACILCAFVPFGTILGVFTIITLTKPEVKDLYQQTLSE